MKIKNFKFLTSSFAGVFASVATTFIVAYGFFKLAGPVPISVSQTTVEKKDTFDVHGEGKVVTSPNIAIINIGVKSEKDSIQEAQKNTNLKINNISEQLNNFQISPKDIQTINYGVYPHYNYKDEQRKIEGYIVDSTLKVTVRDFQKINQVIDTATKLGSTQIGQLHFSIDEETQKELKNQARQQAIKNAKQSASFLAKEVGVKLGKIINLQENPQTNYYPQTINSIKSNSFSENEETSIKSGSTEIKVTMTLSYEIL